MWSRIPSLGLAAAVTVFGTQIEKTLAAVTPIAKPTIPCRLKIGCDDPQLLLNQVASWGIAVANTLFFFMFLWGGFQYLTGAGNESETTKAKGTMIAAVVGILIVTGAWAILRFFILGVTQG